MAMGSARRDPERYGGHGMAVGGMITGFLGVIISGIMIALVALGVVGSFGKAKNLAERAKDGANMRHLAQIATMVASMNPQGRFPENQRELFTNGAAPADFISPGSGTTELRPPYDPNAPGFNIELESHSDYTYVGADLNIHRGGMRESEVIVLYNKDSHLGGRNVAFADGHVEFVDDTKLFELFERSNRARGMMGLAPLALDGPPPMAPPVVQNPGPGIIRPGNPGMNIPPVVQIHTNFLSVDEALTYLNSSRTEERRAALAYISGTEVDKNIRGKVAQALERLLNDPFLKANALQALKTWGSKENAPAVRALLPVGGRPGMGNNEKEAMEVLAQWGDKDSLPAIAGLLKNFFVRDDAKAALITFGADAEEAVEPLTSDSDGATAKLAIEILSKIGTEKSLVAVHKALYTNSRFGAPENADAALAALKEMGTRLKLKPEEYLNAMLNRYKVDAPAGFIADASVDTPNMKQWTRQGAGRTVKSAYTVQLKAVPATYKINAMAGGQSIEAGSLSFKQISQEATSAQTRAVYEALDGEYLVGITMVIDNFDTAAKANILAAAKKIAAK
jgi:prepilin-type processing-associated H-X9-DG protein